jgi:hypothetical protein
MKKVLYFIFFVLVVINKLFSQNLVPNWSFESLTFCPVGPNELYKAYPWFNSTTGSPDYFNACSNGMYVPNNGFCFQYAKTGVAYSGIATWSGLDINYREYLEIELLDSLVHNNSYSVSFYVSLSETIRYSISNIGIYLSDTAIYSLVNTNFPFVPQIENPAGNFLTDTVNWIKISGMYTAHGGEKFITIGNFRDDAHTDTLAANPSQYGYSYYLVDDVTVIDADSVQGLHEQSNISFSISPNPASELLIITLPLNVSSTAFTIVNTMGVIVKQNESTTPQNEMVINIATLPRGVYFVKVKTNKGNGFKKFLKM